MRLIQYLYLFEPEISLKNIIKYNIFHEMLGNIHISFIKDILASFITPGDPLLMVKEKERNVMMSYFKKVNFFQLLIKQIDFIDINMILDEIQRIKKDQAIQSWINALSINDSGAPKQKNAVLGLFQSFFNLKMLNKKHKQPEEMYTNILDIDRCTQNIRSSKKSPNLKTELVKPYQMYQSGSKARLSTGQLSRQSSPNNLDKSLLGEDDNELQRYVFDDDNVKDQVVGSKRVNLLDKDQYEKGHWKNMKKTKALKVFQKITITIIATNILLNNKGYMKKLRTMRLKINCYPENIKIIHPSIREQRKDQQQFFQASMNREKSVLNLIELLHHSVTSYHSNQTKKEFCKKMRMFTAEDEEFINQLFFDPSNNDQFIFKLFRAFVSKIEYHLENKVLFQSSYWCGMLFNFICQNIDFFIEKREDKTEFARQLREYISDACRLVNKAHSLYRFREQEDEVKLPSHLVNSLIF